jgi:hypothetical protein
MSSSFDFLRPPSLVHRTPSIEYRTETERSNVYAYDFSLLDLNVPGGGDARVTVGKFLHNRSLAADHVESFDARRDISSRLELNQAEGSYHCRAMLLRADYFSGADLKAQLSASGPSELRPRPKTPSEMIPLECRQGVGLHTP